MRELKRRLFLLTLHSMKLVLLIFTSLLSFLFGGNADVVDTSSSSARQYSFSENSSSDRAETYSLNREICITAAQGYTFAGNNSNNSVSVRIPQSGRRSSSQTKSTFRVVKSGKVLDNNNINPFLAQSIVHVTGVYLPERYLFSICDLRL